MKKRFGFLLTFCLLLGSCSQAPTQLIPTIAPQPTSMIETDVPQELSETEAPVLHLQETPLHFTFPTPGNQPASLWTKGFQFSFAAVWGMILT